MATKIVTKNSSTAGAAPTATDLVQGELAVNVADKRLFTEDNSGAIVELGTNPATEITANAGIALPDSQKATFGAGDDLQIYHDGGNSYIDDVGTGDLVIRGSSAVYLQKYAGENMLKATADAGVQVFYNNAEKLATTSTGIDVTGTATMDGLTVEGIAEISSTTPTLRFFETDQTDEGTLLRSAGDSFQIAKMLDTGAADGIRLAIDQSSGDISFYEDTGTTPKFFWDASAESLGIGTSSPDSLMHLSANTGATLTLESTDTAIAVNEVIGEIDFYSNDASGIGAASRGSISLIAQDAAGAGSMLFKTSNASTASTERMRIDSSGNVGIASGRLRVASGDDEGTQLNAWSTAGGDGNLAAFNLVFNTGSNSARTERMRINSSGNVGIGTSSPSNTYGTNLHVNSTATSSAIKLTNSSTGTGASDGFELFGSGVNTYLLNREAGFMYFGTSNTERMRIDSSGNVGIGTS